MSTRVVAHRHGIREHLLPAPIRKVVTEADVPSDLLGAFPQIVQELNQCLTYRWRGEGKPGHGWDGWEPDTVSLDVAATLPWAGEA